mmetsp:Transcript_24494/g.83736  ORF Transcript_24494/g.83736 Transcript_24494/m.83736 type:complete len:380 (-) Transcript_24494:10-1149(-)
MRGPVVVRPVRLRPERRNSRDDELRRLGGGGDWLWRAVRRPVLFRCQGARGKRRGRGAAVRFGQKRLLLIFPDQNAQNLPRDVVPRDHVDHRLSKAVELDVAVYHAVVPVRRVDEARRRRRRRPRVRARAGQQLLHRGQHLFRGNLAVFNVNLVNLSEILFNLLPQHLLLRRDALQRRLGVQRRRHGARARGARQRRRNFSHRRQRRRRLRSRHLRQLHVHRLQRRSRDEPLARFPPEEVRRHAAQRHACDDGGDATAGPPRGRVVRLCAARVDDDVTQGAEGERRDALTHGSDDDHRGHVIKRVPHPKYLGPRIQEFLSRLEPPHRQRDLQERHAKRLEAKRANGAQRGRHRLPQETCLRGRVGRKSRLRIHSLQNGK